MKPKKHSDTLHECWSLTVEDGQAPEWRSFEVKAASAPHAAEVHCLRGGLGGDGEAQGPGLRDNLLSGIAIWRQGRVYESDQADFL